MTVIHCERKADGPHAQLGLLGFPQWAPNVCVEKARRRFDELARLFLADELRRKARMFSRKKVIVFLKARLGKRKITCLMA